MCWRRSLLQHLRTCAQSPGLTTLHSQAMGFVGKTLLLAVLLLAVYIGYKVRNGEVDSPAPVLARDVWWGRGERRPEDASIKQFKIQVADDVIVDLNSRLDRFLKKPLTPPLENIGFEYGFNTNYLRTVIQYWKDKYIWKEREKFLNHLPQFTTTVNGLKLHYIRVSPAAEGKRVLPLLLLHGWPGSVREFYEFIPEITKPNADQDFVFDVIAPSLPGYGFSEGPAKPGMGPAEMAVVMNNLMNKIGFKKYYVQGGDWGALISKIIGQLYPTTVLGVHSNMCAVNSPYSNFLTFVGSFYPPLIVEKELEHKMYPWTKTFFYILEETGYFHIQATKPDTIGTALGDTPAGMAGYILEKFSTWTNPAFKKLPDGGLTKKYTLDQLLDNIMIYWVTNSITTSQRLYSEAFTFKQMGHGFDTVPLKVPSACARFHHDLAWTSTTQLKLQYLNLVQVTDHPDGGHFAAFEVPKVLANDLLSAVRKFEDVRNKPKTD